jgi:hypothetical protein
MLYPLTTNPIIFLLLEMESNVVESSLSSLFLCSGAPTRADASYASDLLRLSQQIGNSCL